MTKKQVAKKQSNEVAETNWEQEMAAEAQAVAKTERPSVNKINFQSGVMTYMDNALPDNELDGIIVAHVNEHVFYKDKWKPNVVTPPACFALGLPGEEMIPHDVVPEPIGQTCANCDYFQWGSDLEGGRGKACKERRRLAVLPNVDSIDEIAEAEMATMSLPVMSVRNWANYVNKLSATVQRPPWGVLTKIKLVPDSKSQFRVTFDAVEPLASDFLPAVHARIEGATSALLTPYDMVPQEEQEEGEKNKKY